MEKRLVSRLYILLAAIGLIGPTSLWGQSVNKSLKVAAPYAAGLSDQVLRQHLSVLAHDSLQGREAGTKGHEKACNYLVKTYIRLGIQPLPGTEQYRQVFNTPINKWKQYECLIRDVTDRRYLHGRDFYMLPGTRMPAATGLTDKHQIRWAGLGIDTLGLGTGFDAPEAANTVWIMVDTITSAKFPPQLLKQFPLQKRLSALRRRVRGPIMVVTTRFEWWQNRIADFWDEPAHGFSAGRRSSPPVMVMGPRMSRMLLRKATEHGLFRLWPLFQPYATEGSAMEGFTFLNLEALLNTWAEAAANGKPTGWPYISKADSLKFTLDIYQTTYPSSNVIAYLPGKKKPDEAIVISAHSDHIGRDFFDVYNGADDDGTGTAALLTMAEAYKKASDNGNGPERTIIFMHFSAEEKGLLGSDYYGKNPLWPMDKTIVDLNVDMIGRSDEKHLGQRYIYSIGSDKISKRLKELHEEINTACCQLNLDYFYDRPDDKEHLYERSDHYNFAKYGVPVIFYFSGLHPDYHGVNDHIERIEWLQYLDRTRLIFNTSWHLAGKGVRLK